jgi:hypothetical protein
MRYIDNLFGNNNIQIKFGAADKAVQCPLVSFYQPAARASINAIRLDFEPPRLMP